METKITAVRADGDIREALEIEARKQRLTLSSMGKILWMEALTKRGHDFDSGSPAPASSPQVA